MKISLIVAVAENGVIGRNGALPWHVPSDLKTFRRHTMGKPVIMGRKTYASIGKPLPGRDNIVVTRDAGFSAAGTNRAASIDEALDIARQKAAERGVDEIMVIGGAEIFALTVPLADRIYLDANPRASRRRCDAAGTRSAHLARSLAVAPSRPIRAMTLPQHS